MQTITRQEKGRLFIQYKGMAHHLATKFSQRYRRSYVLLTEEAESKLGLVCCEWDQKYDPSRCAPSTWIYRNLYHHLLDVCTRGKKTGKPFSDFGEEYEPPTENEKRLDTLLKDIGQEARDLVMTILTAPGDLAQDVSTRTPARGRASVCYALKRAGWTEDQISRAWEEVAQCL